MRNNHPFEFFSAARIVFGRGEVRRIGALAKSLGSRPLIVYNGGEAALERVREVLRGEGLEPQSFRQRGEPTVADVERAVAAAREGSHDVVIGVGGGSAIDCAKAVAGVLANGGSPLNYMEVIGAGRPLTKPAAPWIALPTTAGTGAEVTRNAVIGDPSRKFKASLRSELLLPRVALVDPELGVSVPPAVTAASGMDALCQLIESYTSNNANPITRPLAFRGISIAAQALPQVYKNGTNVTARQDMALAALLSGICLTNAGLGAVHGFAAPLGANFPVPHGVVCAALLPHVMAANIAALRAHPLERRRSLPVDVKERSATLRAVMLHPVLGDYALIGRMLSFWEPREGAEDPAAAAALLVESLHIPRLGQFGITEQHVPEMVALARKASSMRYNPVELSDEALAGVLRAAL